MPDANHPTGTPYEQAYGQPASAPAIAVPGAAPVVSAPVAAAAPKAASGKGWIVGLVGVILLFVSIMTGIFSCSSQFDAIASSSGLVDAPAQAAATTDSIGVIEISGTIQYDGTSCSPEGLKSLLDRAEDDPLIRAVVLRVDSGGGTATAGEEMAGYVRGFSKPIVVSSASMNASAAYEISSQADLILTDKTTTIGSIGVAMQITDLSGLYDMLGIEVTDIVSSESKDATYGNRPLTDEERAWYQAMVDQICDDFISTVAEGRDMSYEEVEALANGLPYTGLDAVENGLADRIGGLEDAVEAASSLAGSKEALPVVMLTSTPSSMMDLLDILGSNARRSDAGSAMMLKAQ